jgi:hypothetical protein
MASVLNETRWCRIFFDVRLVLFVVGLLRFHVHSVPLASTFPLCSYRIQCIMDLKLMNVPVADRIMTVVDARNLFDSHDWKLRNRLNFSAGVLTVGVSTRLLDIIMLEDAYVTQQAYMKTVLFVAAAVRLCYNPACANDSRRQLGRYLHQRL